MDTAQPTNTEGIPAMFPNRGRRHQAGQAQPSPAGAQPEAAMPPGASQIRPSHELAESAPLHTVPMPYDVAADHEAIIVYVTEQGPIDEFPEIQHSIMERLTQEASQRGCDAVYGVQQSMAATGSTVLITMMGTGARPLTDLDRPAGLPNASFEAD